VQWRIVDPHWKDFDGTGFPDFSDLRMKWRIKPQVLRYRVALMQDQCGVYYFDLNSNVVHDGAIEGHMNFVRWLHDWQEVEV
jgi:hypothetical protein